jgi:hypothetical protein
MLLIGRGHGSVWRVTEDISDVVPVKTYEVSSNCRPPILFVHGIEFSSASEALQDLVKPVLDILGRNTTADREIFVFAWNSLLTNQHPISDAFKGSLMTKLWRLARELPRCTTYLKDVERRAKEAAQALLPLAITWNSHNKTGPTVISHSMGSLVWAETMKLLLQSSKTLSKPGIWWSLQPALPRGVFKPGGEYEMIPGIYTGKESAKKLVWYSRWDHILSTIYVISKRDFALGQKGCPAGMIAQRDVTEWAREAHGMQHLSSKLGHFFERVAVVLQQDAQQLDL